MWDVKLAGEPQALGGKGLVGLVDVDIIPVDACQVRSLGNGVQETRDRHV